MSKILQGGSYRRKKGEAEHRLVEHTETDPAKIAAARKRATKPSAPETPAMPAASGEPVKPQEK